jgi:DNA polymerase III subunit epsilon
MNWLSRLFGSRPKLDAEQVRRLAKWQALPAADLGAASNASRYVVVDVETSGLNMRTDRLIAIGAVAIQGGAIRLSDSMEIVLRQQRISDRENILIHGISGTAQAEGVPPVEALLGFLEYLGKSPLVAFHVAFDKTMIDRALKTQLGLKFNHAWADLAYVCPALYPELARTNRSLDNWMQRFGINNFARHSALADAVSTAELLLALNQRLQEKRILNFKDIYNLEQAQRMTNWTS